MAIIHWPLKMKTFWTLPLKHIESCGAVCEKNYGALGFLWVMEIWCMMKQCPPHKT